MNWNETYTKIFLKNANIAIGQNTLMFRPKNARWVWTQETDKSFFYPTIKFVKHY